MTLSDFTISIIFAIFSCLFSCLFSLFSPLLSCFCYVFKDLVWVQLIIILQFSLKSIFLVQLNTNK
ncbi:hypothetical protein BD289DRAFT_111752 [Coniella lustricola]|uniref:Uncharacterized protein n=1 Tax=Coniella lustricola TaxID=2025994 RepID=A0A2T3AG67_9PEZI|nr:hypothetical protein BD289DRAFT_111752 [Coniella lustricola]